MAGTWLDFDSQSASIESRGPTPNPNVKRVVGGRGLEPLNLLHVKQGRASETGAASVVERSGGRHRPSGAATRLDIGWTR